MKHGKVLRRLLSSLFAAALLCGCLALTAAAEDTEWLFGDNRFDITGPQAKQGYKGWYFLYAAVSDKGKEFPLSELKEMEFDETAFKWKVPASAGIESGRVSWCGPRKDGYIGTGDGVSAAVKWVCPEDGEYDVQVAYFGEPTGDISKNNGVAYSVYFNNDLVSFEENDANSKVIDEIKYSKKQTLKAGDAFYFIVDPKGSNNGDSPWWRIDIKKTVVAASSEASSTVSEAPASSEPAVSSEVSSAPSSSAEEESDGGFPVLPVVLGVVAVVVVACGVTVLVMYKKRVGPFAKKDDR